MAELGLVCAAAIIDFHACSIGPAALDVGAIGKGERSVMRVPAHHKGIGGGAVYESASGQLGGLVRGRESIAVDRSPSSRIGYPGHNATAVCASRAVASENVRRALYLREHCGDYGEPAVHPLAE